MADYSVQYRIKCDGVITDVATVSGPIIATVVDAVDDSASGAGGATISIDVTPNDTIQNCNNTTFQSHNAVRCSVSGGTNNGVFSVTLDTIAASPTPCTATFQYDILCDGVVKDTATVTIQRTGTATGTPVLYTSDDLVVVDYNDVGQVGQYGNVGDDNLGHYITDYNSQGDQVAGGLFQGDAANGIPAQPKMAVMNGNQTGNNPATLFTIALSGLTPGATYNMATYFRNPLDINDPPEWLPSVISMEFNGNQVMSPTTIPRHSNSTEFHVWDRFEGNFTATGTTGTMTVKEHGNDGNSNMGIDNAFAVLAVSEVFNCP